MSAPAFGHIGTEQRSSSAIPGQFDHGYRSCSISATPIPILGLNFTPVQDIFIGRRRRHIIKMTDANGNFLFRQQRNLSINAKPIVYAMTSPRRSQTRRSRHRDIRTSGWPAMTDRPPMA